VSLSSRHLVGQPIISFPLTLSTLDILEAAHISPYRGEEDNHPENGLLLRADLHTLFDHLNAAIHAMDIIPIGIKFLMVFNPT
jgi:HNH endonuclease